jgi:hypothetical protein
MNVSPPSEATDQPLDNSPAPGLAAASPPTQASHIDRPRADRFRRGLDRLRSASDAATEGLQTGEEDLDLTVHLLREENARLKAERYRPPDVGTMIDQLRRIAEEQGDERLSDNAWSLLTECLLIREELGQACIEIKAAIDAVQTRLGKLQITLHDTNSHPSSTVDPPDPSLPEDDSTQTPRNHLKALPIDKQHVSDPPRRR